MAAPPDTTQWIAVDWGATTLRVWMIGVDGRPVASKGSDHGPEGLTGDEFEDALLALIAPYLTNDRVMPVVCCGMAGVLQDRVKTPCLVAPCAPPGGQAMTRVGATDTRISVFILPGVQQMAPPDVMQGEETQIAGFLATRPDFDGVLCLPGIHTKWVQISAGEIVSFQTFMTGELFALLATGSVLRQCVSTDGFDQTAFAGAIADALTRPQALAAQLFGLHAGSLIAGLRPATARARLSGLLIGVELAAARPYWLGQQVVIIGDREVAALYRSGLDAQGLAAAISDPADMTLAGLVAAYQSSGRPRK